MQSSVQTVVDPSIAASTSGSGKISHSAKSNPVMKARLDEDEMAFLDSRGTGPRKTTEEGHLIYKEDELGIKDSSGDTELCPFDCDCCF